MLSVILITTISVSLLITILNICIYCIFTTKNNLVASSFATRKSYTHKENANMLTSRNRVLRFYKIRHLTKSSYIYKVNGKDYVLRKEYYTSPGETPRTVGIKYIKACPKIAVCNELGDSADCFEFILRAISGFTVAVACLLITFKL